MSTQSPPLNPPKRTNTGLIVGIVVALVAAAAIVFAVAGGRSTKKDVVASSPSGENQAVVVAGDALPDMPDSGADPAVGKKAPTLHGYGFNGSPVDIVPGQGKAQLVVFVAHWCPHCQREVPLLVAWMASGKARPDLQITAVSTGVAKERGNWPPSAWLAKVNWPKPVVADSADREAATAYGLTSYPYFVVLKADGTVAYRGSGEISMTDLSAKLDEVLGKAA